MPGIHVGDRTYRRSPGVKATASRSYCALSSTRSNLNAWSRNIWRDDNDCLQRGDRPSFGRNKNHTLHPQRIRTWVASPSESMWMKVIVSFVPIRPQLRSSNGYESWRVKELLDFVKWYAVLSEEKDLEDEYSEELSGRSRALSIIPLLLSELSSTSRKVPDTVFGKCIAILSNSSTSKPSSLSSSSHPSS